MTHLRVLEKMAERAGSALSVAVVGSGGGIGRAVTHVLSSSPAVARVHSLSRASTAATFGSKVIPHNCDTLDASSVRAAASSVLASENAFLAENAGKGEAGQSPGEAGKAARERGKAPLSLVFVATGFLHADGVSPERSWRAIDPDAMRAVLEVNTIGPAIVAREFLPLLRKDASRGRGRAPDRSETPLSAFAAVSARVGSIGDNGIGGWYSYRASKAALNQVIRTVSIELARVNPHAACFSIHPGTVDTDLSKPFQGNVPEGKLFTPEVSANHMLRVIDDRTLADSGGFYAWDGSKIPW